MESRKNCDAPTMIRFLVHIILTTDSCVFAVLKKLLPTNAACEDILKKKVCLLIFARICSTYFTRKMQRKNPSTDPRYYSSWPTMCWHQKPLPLNQWKKRLVNLRWLEVWIGCKFRLAIHHPDAPCMDYLEKWPQSRGNVGKYSVLGGSSQWM